MKKASIVLILTLLIPLQATAMSQPVFSVQGHLAGVSGSTRWFGCGSGAVSQSSHALSGAPIAISGTLGNLQVSLDTAPGAGNVTTFTVEKDDVDTTQTCTISDTATTCSSANTVSFTAGETCSIRSQATTGTPASASANVSHSFVADTDNESFIAGVSANVISSTATQYYAAYGGTGTTTLAQATSTMPTSGTVDRLYVALSGTPLAGRSYTFTLYKNGVATGLTCTIADTNTTCNDLSNSVSFAAGDSIAMETVPTANPSNRAAKWGVRFSPTINGESVLFVRETNNSNTIRYHAVQGPGNRSTNENSVQIVAPLNFQMRKFYLAAVYGQPSGASTRPVFLRKNGVTQALGGTLTSSAGWVTDLSNTVDYTAGDLLNVIISFTGTPPTTVLEYWSMVAYVDPGTPASSSLPYRIYNLGQMLLNNGTLILR